MLNESYIFLLKYGTELVGLQGVISVVIFAMLNYNNWRTSSFALLIYKLANSILAVMLFILIVTEFYWYLLNLDTDYYNLARFSSSFLAILIKLFIVSITMVCLSLHTTYFADSSNEEIWEYPILIVIATIAMLVLISCNDLIVAYIALELQSIILYVLIGLKRYSNISVEATIKYFINAAFCSALLLMGISLLYSQLGVTNFIEISVLELSSATNYIVWLGALFILSGFLFKFAMVPLYFWIGDVFHGSYGYFGSYVAIVTKFPVLYLFLKIYLYVLIALPYFTILIKFLCLISIVVSNIYAINELSFKRFWALTSISHSSYIVLAIVLSDYKSVAIAVLYMIIYLISSLGIWILAMSITKQVASDFTLSEFFNSLPRFSSMQSIQIGYSLAATLLLFSVAGIPPAAGFLPKFLIYWQLYLMGDFFLLFCIFFVQLVSMAYYIRFIRFLLFTRSDEVVRIESYNQMSPYKVFLFVNIILINIIFIYYFIDLFILLDYWSLNCFN